MSEVRHSIKLVSKRTGLSPHVIRVWEKRYGTIQPHRTEGNRRTYGQEDIDRLTLLKRAIDAGHSIGDIARLPQEQLVELVRHAESLARPSPTHGERPAVPQLDALRMSVGAPADLVREAYAAVVAMDVNWLERVLERAVLALGQVGMLRELVVPLVEQIGEGWMKGELKVVQEHIASAAIRTFLGQVARPIAIHPSAPGILVTTPAGQLHELGAVLVAAAATNYGWRVVYAGACLPAEEIVSAAVAHRIRVVALSVVHPADDDALPDEMRRLRRLLPEVIQIIVGGRAASGYGGLWDEIGAQSLRSLAGLESFLGSNRDSVWNNRPGGGTGSAVQASSPAAGHAESRHRA